MTPNQLRNDIQNACDLLVNQGISLFNQPIYVERTDTRVRITWKQTPLTQARPYKFGSIEQYISIIRDGSFTCALLDGSLLRLAYTFERNDLISHNLWYYPCPFNIPRDELVIEPLLDIIEMYAESGIEHWRMKGPIRFDFDAKRAKAIFHPASHAHFLHEFCRVPVRKPLSPGKFLKFIFFNFYQDLLSEYSFLIEWPEANFKQTIFSIEEKLMHFSWT